MLIQHVPRLPAELCMGAVDAADVVSVTLTRQHMIDLVHQIQRERGVTCGWVAAGGVGKFGSLVYDCRASTDTALAAYKAEKTRLAVTVIRNDAASAIRRASGLGVSKGWSSKADTLEGRAQDFYGIFKHFNQLVRRLLEERTMLRANGAFETRKSDAAFDDFALLKEATGVERAFLCGALALPADCLPQLPTRVFADLVIGLQQQRAYETSLRSSTPPHLLELLQAGFEYSPELQTVQDRLLKDFDVAALRLDLSADRCWQVRMHMAHRHVHMHMCIHAYVHICLELTEPADAGSCSRSTLTSSSGCRRSTPRLLSSSMRHRPISGRSPKKKAPWVRVAPTGRLRRAMYMSSGRWMLYSCASCGIKQRVAGSILQG